MGTYWENKGKYQELSEEIEKLIPPVGEASTPELELFRITGNAYHELYNNSGFNFQRLKDCGSICKLFADKLMSNGLRLIDMERIEWISKEPGFYHPDLLPEIFETFERLSDAATLIASENLSK
jgi:hypothetical protein